MANHPIEPHNDQSEAEAKAKIFALIKDIRVAMMATQGTNASFHARPMAPILDKGNDKLWFFTDSASGKIEEIERNPMVLLSFSDPTNQHYISMNGRAHIVRERSKIKELWNEHLRTWFPKGPEQDDIALIHFHPESAEYWDAPSSTVVYAYGYLKARLTGKPPAPGDHDTASFNAA